MSMRAKVQPIDVLGQAARWRDERRRVALATVVATWGSSPRPVGSQLAVDDRNNMLGSVSGGCIEGAVAQEAATVMRTGEPQLLEYGVSDEQAWELGLACGGTVKVFVERLGGAPGMRRALLDRLLQRLAQKRPVALVTDLATGRQSLIGDDRPEGELELDGERLAAAAGAMAADRSGVLPGEDGLFVQVFNPPPRMIVIGAVHIAQALVPMAELAGYEVVVVDPRGAWATEERFPGVTVTKDWPDEALARLDLDRRTAVVALTHDPKLDDPALTVALGSEAFYVGALGSRRTHARRLERLREGGLSEADLARIHGPIGLALGARSPAEIAVSILAQVTQVLHGAPPPVSPEAAA
ncbi:MAG: XdhC family protein [Rhodospirillales bacterium]|nr:XdhC family protein [Rhodospirillales bacterium]